MFSVIDIQIQESQKDITEYQRSGIDTNKIKHQYLRSFVLLIVSEYEYLIERIFYLRASKCNDNQIVNYVKNQIDKKFRSPDLSKINKTLSLFDDTLKHDFFNKTNNLPMHSAWDNIMKARHYIVHKQGSLNLTYDELLKTYPVSKNIIVELINILGVSANDLV